MMTCGDGPLCAIRRAKRPAIKRKRAAPYAPRSLKMNKLLQVRYEELYNNCIYSAIAHAISILKEPFFAYTQSWDGYNYSFHYGSTRGTISFYDNQKLAVGAARDETSTRRKLYPQYNAITLFHEASTTIQEKALQDPLEYLYDEENGITKPMASVGFWLEDNCIFSSDALEDFSNHGGEFVFILAKERAELVAYWKEEYALTAEELSAVDDIFQCWKSNEKLVLKQFKHVIKKKAPGFEECIKSLKELELEIK